MAKKRLLTMVKVVFTAIMVFYGITTTLSIVAYNAFFVKISPKSADVTAGNYCYERVEHRLARETLIIPSGGNDLQGYWYPAGQSYGTVVLCHGFHNGADDYLPIIEYFVSRNFDVLAYDGTGVYNSEGSGLVGMPQQLIDLDNVLQFVANHPDMSAKPLFLFGHSMGGYACASVLALRGTLVNACACIAPVNDASTLMMDVCKQYVGNWVLVSQGVFEGYQRAIFGEWLQYNGVDGINSVDIPVFIAQGLYDTLIPHDTLSITAHADQITNPNVTIYYQNGLQGSHTDLMYSKHATIYRQGIQQKLENCKYNTKRKKQIVATVDHDLYSQVNTELLDKIVQMYLDTIK